MRTGRSNKDGAELKQAEDVTSTVGPQAALTGRERVESRLRSHSGTFPTSCTDVTATGSRSHTSQRLLNYLLWHGLDFKAIIIINKKRKSPFARCVWMVSFLASLGASSFHGPSTRRSGFVKLAQPAIVQVPLLNSVSPSALRRLSDWQGGEGVDG